MRMARFQSNCSLPTNTVAYQSVKLGPLIDGKRIVCSGLQGTEKIIVNGLQRVRPGMIVTAQEEATSNEDLAVAKR